LSAMEVTFAPAARRDIRKFDKQIQTLFIRAIEALSVNPRPTGAEKLKGYPGFLRVRAGADHRVIYSLHEGRLVVVLVLRNRKDAYRGLDNLGAKLEAALTEISAASGPKPPTKG
jgi:mRNA interferase RelE/StbE